MSVRQLRRCVRREMRGGESGGREPGEAGTIIEHLENLWIHQHYILLDYT